MPFFLRMLVEHENQSKSDDKSSSDDDGILSDNASQFSGETLHSARATDISGDILGRSTDVDVQ